MNGHMDHLLNKPTPGGCPDCDAVQTFARDEDGIYHLLIEHDPTCPALARMTREKNQNE